MKFNREKLAELQAKHLPVLTAADLGLVPLPDADPEQVKKDLATWDAYLKQFTPGKDCICCGSPLAAKDPVSALLGGASFEWGLAHGEGHCCKCGYPSRGIHYVGEARLPLILQYHPDDVGFDPKGVDTQ